MPGAQCTRSLACEINKAHERRHHRSTGITRHSRTQWFYGLYRALPGERILVVTVAGGLKAQSNPVGLDVASASLAPATGVRTTRLCRPLKRRSSRAPSIAHEVHLALRPTIAPDAVASTASRPALVTTRDRPSVGRDAIDIDLILVKRIRKYFCKRGWTGKSPGTRRANQLSIGANVSAPSQPACSSCATSRGRPFGGTAKRAARRARERQY